MTVKTIGVAALRVLHAGPMRTRDLSRLLKTSTTTLAAAMRPLVAAGEVVACQVRRRGEPFEHEYRIVGAGPARLRISLGRLTVRAVPGHVHRPSSAHDADGR